MIGDLVFVGVLQGATLGGCFVFILLKWFLVAIVGVVVCGIYGFIVGCLRFAGRAGLTGSVILI